MKMKYFFYLLTLCLFFQCGKDDDNSTGNNGNVPTDFEVPLVLPDGSEQYLNLNSEYIFDQEQLHDFELQLPAAHLDEIDSDPAAEQYVEGMLIFQGDTISPVGIRYKGSIGAFVNCTSGVNVFNPSGKKTCTKLSMKVKINWEDREERFYGLNKLQFHSQNLDPTHLHERLGYHLFQAMGIPAPRSVHARLTINGTYVGLFALTEQIDGRFAKYHFEDDDGNVYKEIWPINDDGNPFGEQAYINALKTNEDSPTVDLMQGFGQQIASATSDQLLNVISETMDLNEIITYAVVDRTIRHDDGPFHWYCTGNDCSNHNYYWYEEPTNKKLHLIPWDLDNAFDNINGAANAVTNIPDAWGAVSNNCQPFGGIFFGFSQRSAACDKLTAGWASNMMLFENIKASFINGPFAEAEVDALLEKWTDQIRASVIEASEAHNDAPSLNEWENAVDDLKGKLNFARNN